MSRLPQELLEKIVTSMQQSKREETQPIWRQDLTCFRGMCEPEDHYRVFGEHVEKFWRDLIHDGCCTAPSDCDVRDPTSYTEAEKIEMVIEAISDDSSSYMGEEEYTLHEDAITRWIDRTCTCENQDKDFIPLNRVS